MKKSTALLVLPFLFFSCSQKTDKPYEDKPTVSYHKIFDLTTTSPSDSLELEFSQKDIDGNTIKLSGYKSKIVLINFWGTWCGPCKQEMPGFVALQAKFENEIQFIGVSTLPENLDKVREFGEEININYPLIIDPENIPSKYLPQAWPSTYIISKEGKPLRLIIGSTSLELLEAELNTILEKT